MTLSPMFILAALALVVFLALSGREAIVARAGLPLYRGVLAGLIVAMVAALAFSAYSSGYRTGEDSALRDNRADARAAVAQPAS